MAEADLETKDVIGLIPAAGKGTRLGTLPCSKEILPLGSLINDDGGNAEHRIRVAIDHSLSALTVAGISRAVVVLAPHKRDIVAYLNKNKHHELNIEYVFTENSPSVPYSLDCAYVATRDQDVVLLFPDIIFTPANLVGDIVSRRVEAGADIALALVPSEKGDKIDIVAIDDDESVISVSPKPGVGISGWTWVAAAWSPAFTEFLHRWVASSSERAAAAAGRELYVADVINAAIDAELTATALSWSNGESWDLGTPGELQEFRQARGYLAD